MRDWRVKQAERILKEQKGRWTKHRAPVFGDKKTVLVIAQDLQEYQATRIEDGARYATINRELQLLRRAFRLGFERRPKLVSEVPRFQNGWPSLRAPASSRTRPLRSCWLPSRSRAFAGWS